MTCNMFSFSLLWLSLPVVFANTSRPTAPLPVVDLGYAVHQATVNNSGYQYYNFSNIRFGAAPTASLRFAPPIPPQAVNRTVNDGQQTQNCAQANPAWLLTAEKFLEGELVASLANQSSSGSLNISSLPRPNSQTSEDCLFLDVIVPKSIYESAWKKNDREDRKSSGYVDEGAAVLVWIYGGGYTAGTKSLNGNPAGILARSQDYNGEGVIFVAINYRLGLFGWLSGTSFLEREGSTANVGLYDQRFALGWVQKYIHLFGGSRCRVTIIGESAGGGSIEHQITAYGGRGEVPFQQAILQSPGFKPKPDFVEQEAIFQKTLSYASLIAGKKIATVHDLAALSHTELFLTNYILVGTAAYGDFVFGPVVNGNFVPDLPGKLLIEGHFHHDLNVMVAYNSAEGLVFSSPFLQNTSDFDAYVQSLLPAALPSVITYITDVLYPDTTHGAQGYETQLARTSDFYSEFVFSCNTRYLDLAFKNKTYAYIFSVPPGLHKSDVPYTFFNGDTTTVDDEYPVNATIAIALQEYITNFAITGNPNRKAVNIPYFLPYGVNSSMLNLGFAGFGAQEIDNAANSRCAWWQQALYT